MTVRKLDDGKPKSWFADVRPDGVNGPRLRKRFMTKGEALAWERHQLTNKPWLKEPEPENEPQEQHRLLDLVRLWYGRHGQTLADGDRRRDKLVCSGQLNPDTRLGRSSAFAGGIPSLC